MISRKQDLALLLLRLTFGGLMILGHGWGKFDKLLAGAPYEFGDPIGLGPTVSLFLAVFAEVLCAFFIVIGLFTRYATIPLIFTMLVAIFFVNLGAPLANVEKAILYLVPFAVLLLTGPGWYSVDAQWRKVI